MRVLMLSWEYPPVVVGGLGRHVHALATTLAEQGHEVAVLCRQPAGTDALTHPPTDDVVDGVRLVRVAEDPPQLTFERDLFAWTLAMGHAMVRAGNQLLDGWRPDVVHAHDWLVTHPAIALAEAAGCPLVATIHATEAGRHSGWLSRTLSQQIHSVEWLLAQRADRLITCSAAMRVEVTRLFDIDPAAISVLHNGIVSQRWQALERAVERRSRSTARAPRLLFFGRLEYEKGVQDLIAALPYIRERHPGAVATIAGQGAQRDWLVQQAAEQGADEAVNFVGHLGDRELADLLTSADAAVFPSRYEPFGIVALEAAAAGAPLVTSTAGGLGEIVHHEHTGLSFAPGDVAGLVDAVDRVLADPAGARARAEAAQGLLGTHFSWPHIAAETAAAYATTERGPQPVLGKPKIATGNVLNG